MSIISSLTYRVAKKSRKQDGTQFVGNPELYPTHAIWCLNKIGLMTPSLYISKMFTSELAEQVCL